MNQHISGKQTIAIGLMLFALFLGAGNIIFPPFLGQQAGTNLWIAVFGFLVTGVGLPLLGVIAIAKSGDLETLANRVSPVFGLIFSIVLYLAIGPLFGIPRTGIVAYEIGVTPFLAPETVKSALPLFIYTVIFFLITAWLSLNPAKLVDRIGKIITPLMIAVLIILVAKSFISPMGEPSQPSGEYVTHPFFKGFIEGYLTMDAIASLVFGIVVISSIKGMGITNPKSITKACVTAGLIAALGLAFVYISLTYIGATSIDVIGRMDNGGSIISASAKYFYGPFGTIILGLTITFACLTTSIGLVSSCAKYFSEVFTSVSYKTLVIIISVFSTIVANIGLTQLLSISLPVLVFVYPLAIVLIILSFLHNGFGGSPIVYKISLIFTGIVSLVDGLAAANIHIPFLDSLYNSLPLSSQGIGWVVPAIVGALIGIAISSFNRKNSN
ncbi:branched-chain amino acid transport system II carrier protein [Peribacillus alkalitolerans]|uniref:branched-chain amino acid transport system II carrier protein n=1 Tax=Peribacillus alkalitolerans TaxID=1550385 RepID=UPI0013D16342|nr:branched-chain amino acid transport system II carrier protein [Peribacillus alkalitolerans]